MKTFFKIFSFFSLFLMFYTKTYNKDFVSGDAFKQFCNFVLDQNSNFDPIQVKCGDTIFVKADYLDKFFNLYHPKIQTKYILVTHNSDFSAPGGFKKYIEDEKIFAWFAQNMDLSHPKLIPIPIGLENNHWGRNYETIISELNLNQINVEQKKYFMYMNFSIETNPGERELVYKLFKDKEFCYSMFSKKNTKDYLIDVKNSKFIISPKGNGLDCHRTWEAFYLNTYVILKSSSIDSLFNGLPVVIVNDWKEVTLEFLQEKFLEMKVIKYKTEKLYFDYWKNLILNYQTKCRELIH